MIFLFFCRCDSVTPVMYNILERYKEVTNYIITNRNTMFNRAPPEWLFPPALPDCHACGRQGFMRPVIAVKKRHINWLFLLLGQTLGCCNLDQLKYFCKHSNNHRTGSKSHVLYLTYLTLCNQLDPSFGSFWLYLVVPERVNPLWYSLYFEAFYNCANVIHYFIISYIVDHTIIR